MKDQNRPYVTSNRMPQKGLRGASVSRNAPEVTVTKHFQPNSAQRKTGQIPELSYLDQFAQGSRYLHLHPVFKFVDTFLSSTAVGDKSSPRQSRKAVAKCDCTRKDNLPNVGGDAATKTQKRIKTNLNNIQTKNNLRVSLKASSPKGINSDHGKCTGSCGSEYYVELLKSEIKDNDYAERLKEEITDNKIKCFQEAKNIITELKTEILNFRHCATANCSEPEKSEAKVDESTDRRRDASRDKDSTDRGEERWETLWRSGGSLPSSNSAEDDAVLNFEEKLEEARYLIDRVRKTLQDLGRSVVKQSEEKKLNEEKEEKHISISLPSEATSSVEEIKNKSEKEVHELDIMSDDVQSTDAITTPVDSIQLLHSRLDKINEAPSDKIPEAPLDKTPEISSGNGNRCMSVEKKNEAVQIEVCRMDRASSAIDCFFETNLEEIKVAEELVNDTKLEELTFTDEVHPSESIVLQELFKSPSLDDTGRSESNKSEILSEKSQPHLAIQKLPSITIRRGMVVQKTLNLCIKPTGSITNDIVPKSSNVAYEEVIEDSGETQVKDKRCPDECRNEEGLCQSKILEHIIDSERSTMGETAAKILKNTLINPKDAILCLKSYQVVDTPEYSEMPLSTIQQIMKNVTKEPFGLDTISSHPTGSSIAVELRKENDKFSVMDLKRGTDRSRLPFDIGFYDTKSTQCSMISSVVDASLSEPQKADPTEKPASRGGTASSSSAPSMDSHNLESKKSQISPNSEDEMSGDEPVKDSNDLTKINMEAILKALRDPENMVPRSFDETISDSVSVTPSQQSRKSILIMSPNNEIEDQQKHDPPSPSPNVQPKKSILSTRLSLMTSDSPYKENISISSSSSGSVKMQVKKNVIKVDQALQVSLESSSDDSDSETQGSSTVTQFIQGLTGTSKEEMRRSTRSEIPSAKAFRDRQLSPKNTYYESTLEEVIQTQEYVQNPPDEQSVSILSEDTKKQNLKEFQRMMSAGMNSSRTVMRMNEATPKPRLPFYKRVMGKIIEPAGKINIQQSASDPHPVDESLSEGEIGCKTCSLSMGEIHPCVFLKHPTKRHNKPLKSHKKNELRIARQRAQYSNWVTYFLQRQPKPADDYSDSFSFEGATK